MFCKSLFAVVGLASSCLLAGPALADTFSFSFNAPVPGNDTFSGSGTIATAAADPANGFEILSVSGSWVPYQPYMFNGITFSASPNAITGFANPLSANPVYLTPITGGYAVDGISFFGGDFLSATRNGDGSYTVEGADGNTAPAATFTFTRLVSAPVPESATWVLMIGGFGTLGVGMRRQRRLAVAG